MAIPGDCITISYASFSDGTERQRWPMNGSKNVNLLNLTDTGPIGQSATLSQVRARSRPAAPTPSPFSASLSPHIIPL
jgi:hypothetical protein